MAASLGVNKVANIHLDKYTSELKTLIGKLHDDNLDVGFLKSNTKRQISNDFNPDINDELGIDSDDEGRNAAGNNKLREIMKMTENGPSNERKEKLKVRLLNESQTYYQNNLNIFSNGMSLLAVNSLEVHGMVH